MGISIGFDADEHSAPINPDIIAVALKGALLEAIKCRRAVGLEPIQVTVQCPYLMESHVFLYQGCITAFRISASSWAFSWAFSAGQSFGK